MTKITLIGGGSYTWGPTFLRDLFVTPELKGSTVVLHDISAERMERVYRLGRKMLADFHLDFELEQTLSLAEALQGADFIILTITTGGLEAMHHYSLFQPQKSKLAVPNAFPEYFDFQNMHLPEAKRACQREAVWLDESVFRAGRQGVDDAVAVLKKIQQHAADLRRAAEAL